MKNLATQGRVAEVGPFTDGSGALFIYEGDAHTVGLIRKLVHGD
jgi:hypothetical protein